MSKKKNLPEKTENNNDDKELVENTAMEVVENVANVKNFDQQVKFHCYRLFGLPIKTCAKLAGYTVNYGYQLVRKYKHDPKQQAKLAEIADLFPDHYRTVCKLRLPVVAEIEGKALGEYSKQPSLAIDKPQLLKQVKTAAGVVTDEATRPQIVSIDTLIQVQNVMLQDQDKRLKRVKAEVVDAEAKELKE